MSPNSEHTCANGTTLDEELAIQLKVLTAFTDALKASNACMHVQMLCAAKAAGYVAMKLTKYQDGDNLAMRAAAVLELTKTVLENIAIGARLGEEHRHEQRAKQQSESPSSGPARSRDGGERPN